MADQRLVDDEPGDWVSLVDASSRLGVSVDALRSRARRGMITMRRGNDGRLQVRVLASQTAVTDQPADRSRLDSDGVDDEALAELREEIVELRVTVARLEAERDAARVGANVEIAAAKAVAAAEVAAVRAEVTAKEMVITELRELLTDARRPWWRRWAARHDR
mgnify:CR=1 FL=1